MTMFSNNAKVYIQLSGAGLALTLTFAREILHIPKDQNIVDVWVVIMWSCFLVAILAGAFYQYLAAKYVERIIDWEHLEMWDWLPAGTIYGVMLAAFYGGTIIFTIYAVLRLKHA
jgi:hypothetical protein